MGRIQEEVAGTVDGSAVPDAEAVREVAETAQWLDNLLQQDLIAGSEKAVTAELAAP